MPQIRRLRPGLTAVALAAGGLFPVTALAVPTAQAASTTTLDASPAGSGTARSSSSPCSVAQAQKSVRAIDGDMSGDIVVQLAGAPTACRHRWPSPTPTREPTATPSPGRPRPARSRS